MPREYPNTLQAISTYFTDFTETNTTTTDPVALRAELTGKDVFLIPEQETATLTQLGNLGTSWAAVLNDFVPDGGTGGRLRHNSMTRGEERILLNSGLMNLTKTTVATNGQVVPVGTHLLTEGIVGTVSGRYLSMFTTTTATVVMQTATDGKPVVLVEDHGAGHAVMIGTDYYDLGYEMDKVVANAVKWAQQPGATPVPITPVTASFVAGVWTGDVTVLDAATGMYLRADNGSGHIGESNTFDVETLPPLTVDVPAEAGEGDGVLVDGGIVSIPLSLGADLTVSLSSDDASEAGVAATVTIAAGADLGQVRHYGDRRRGSGLPATGNDYRIGGGVHAWKRHDRRFRRRNGRADGDGAGSALESGGVLAEAGTVTLDRVPTSDVLIELNSADTTEVTVPSTVTILAGQTSAKFDVTIVDDAEIDGIQTAMVGAHAPYANIPNASPAAIAVSDNDAYLAVQLPAAAWENAGTLVGLGTVTIGGTLTYDLTVSLRSDDTSELEDPAAVTILAGQTSATFALKVVDDPDQDGVQTVTVTASAPGLAGGGKSMLVRDDELHHFSFDAIASPQLADEAFGVRSRPSTSTGRRSWCTGETCC